MANRALVPTRWTSAKSHATEIGGWATLMLHSKWLIAYSGEEKMRSFQGPTSGFADTLSSRTHDVSLGRLNGSGAIVQCEWGFLDVDNM